MVVASKPGDSVHSIIFGHQESNRFLHLVLPTDGSAITSPGIEVSTPNVTFSSLDLFAVHPDPVAAGALYLANLNTIWYRAANSDMSVVAGSSRAAYKDGVGEAARFSCVLGLLATRDGKSLFVADHTNSRVRGISFETAGSKAGTVRTVAGDGQTVNRDGIGLKASLFFPREMLWISEDEQTEMLVSCGYQINRLNTKTCNQPLIAITSNACERADVCSIVLCCVTGLM